MKPGTSKHRPTGPSAREVLAAYPDFRLLALSQVISDFGNSLTSLALVIVVNDITGSTTAVATMFIALGLPQLLVGLLAGVYMDRWDPKRTLVVADAIRALLVAAFIPAAAAQSLPALYALAIAQATVGTFFRPNAVLMPLLLPESALLSANSLLKTGRILASMAGAGAAGLIIGLAHATWPVFATDALTFVLSLVLISAIRTRTQPEATPESRAEPVWRQLADGLKAIGRSRALSAVLVAVGIGELGAGTVNLLFVPFLRNDLQVNIAWLGSVEVAITAATVVGGAALSLIASRLQPQGIAVSSLFLLGGAVALVSLTTSIWQLLLVAFLVGLSVAPLQASLQTIFQVSVARGMRGRVGATMGTVSSASSIVSMALAGLFGDEVGVRAVFLIAGAITVAAGLLTAGMFRRAPEFTSPAQTVAAAD